MNTDLKFPLKPRHAPEPWKFGGTEDGKIAIWKSKPVGEPECLIAVNAENVPLLLARENASRIVACVNACEGLNPSGICAAVAFLREYASILCTCEDKSGPCDCCAARKCLQLLVGDV